MNEFIFGTGDGWLPKRVDAIAKKRGAVLVNHTDPQCSCGYGCAPHECRRSRRHWFATENMGEPFNSRLEAAVMGEIR